jgi:hypothetical protein
MPELQQLKLETLPELKGGQLRDDFNRLLANIISDCNQRPGINKPRTLTLKLKLTPVGGTMGLDSVNVEDTVVYTMPGFAHGASNMQPRKLRGGQMMLAFDPNEREGFLEHDEE